MAAQYTGKKVNKYFRMIENKIKYFHKSFLCLSGRSWGSLAWLTRTAITTATEVAANTSSTDWSNHRDTWQVFKVEGLEHALGIWVDLNGAGVKSGKLWDKVVLAFALLLLQLERDSWNRTLLNTLHQMSSESSDLVAQTLRGNDSHIVADALVSVEVESEEWVVLLNQATRGPLNSFGTNATLLKCKFQII